MTQATNPNARPGRPSLRRHQFVVDWRIMTVSVVLIVLAVGTVLTTAQFNHQQNRLLNCGATVVTQTINALKARDDVQRQVTAASNEVVLARERVLHAVADAVTGRNSSTVVIDNAMGVYDQAVTKYQTATAATTTALNNAPLPTVDCLRPPG